MTSRAEPLFRTERSGANLFPALPDVVSKTKNSPATSGCFTLPPLIYVLLLLTYFSPTVKIFSTPDCVELPHTTLEPQTTLRPLCVLSPQTTESPQTTDWPLTVELENTVDPHTKDWPQTTESPQTTELSETSLVGEICG